MKQLITFFIAILAVSCSNSNDQDFTSIPSIPIKGELLEEEIISTSEGVPLLIDSCFIICDSNNPEALISILDEATGKQIATLGTRGNGPGEFKNPLHLGRTADKDTLYIANWANRIYTYLRKERGKYEWIGERKIHLKKMEIPMDMHRMENGYYVMTTLSGGQEFFVLLDRECKEIKRFGSHPVKGMTADACDFIPFQGRMTSCGNSFYFATMEFGYIVRYDISDTGEVSLAWEKSLSEPQVKISEANIRIKGSSNLGGFYGLAANEDYLFATYSGIYFNAFIDTGNPGACVPETLVVFKTDGEIVGKYRFPNKSSKVCLSEDNKRLYLWNSEPEVAIERYNVEDILNAK